MKEADELRNFWNNKEKVEKVEKFLLNKQETKEEKKEENFINLNDLPNEKKENIEIIFNSEDNEEKEKRKFILLSIIFGILFICSIIITFVVIDKIKELKTQEKINFKYIK